MSAPSLIAFPENSSMLHKFPKRRAAVLLDLAQREAELPACREVLESAGYDIVVFGSKTSERDGTTKAVHAASPETPCPGVEPDAYDIVVALGDSAENLRDRIKADGGASLLKRMALVPIDVLKAIWTASHSHGEPLLDIRDRVHAVRVSANELLAVKAAGNYIELALRDGRRPLIRATLKAVEHELSSFGFVRVHRSWLVNIHLVRQVDRLGTGDRLLTCKGGFAVPCSRRHAARVDTALGAARDHKLRLRPSSVIRE